MDFVATALATVGLTSSEFGLAATVLFLAGAVRGFSGFGFSMVAVTGLSLLRPPAEVIPVVMLLEVLASLHLLVTSWRDAEWRSLRWLILGMAGATPFGTLILATTPANAMRAVVSMLVLIAALALRSGWRRHATPGTGAVVGIGALAGFLNGAASIAGPPIIVFYLSSPAAVATSRASMIAFFLAADVVALLSGGAVGLISERTWLRVAYFVIPVTAGIVLGQGLFVRTSAEEFRRLVLAVLIVLAIAGLVRALATSFGSVVP